MEAKYYILSKHDESNTPSGWLQKAEERKKRRENLANFLTWLITPQDEKEQERFGAVVDEYIELSQRIPSMCVNHADVENFKLKEQRLQTKGGEN